MKSQGELILEFAKHMKPTDHVILFYSKPDDKRSLLFAYLNSGLQKGEAAAYVGSQETPDRIKEGMSAHGIAVDTYERSGALRVIPYTDWYIVDGKFSSTKTNERWSRLYEESRSNGFKGLRVTGETACFFEHNMLKELVDYEKSLHRVLQVPMTAICAYDVNLVPIELYRDLIEAHSNVIFLGPSDSIMSAA
jgi:hypothetical protein